MQIVPYNISMSKKKNRKCNYLMRGHLSFHLSFLELQKSLKTVWTVADVTFSLCHE